MKRLTLEISSHITDQEVEVLTYQIGGTAWHFTSELVKRRTESPYLHVIGEVPDSWDVALLTPDARLSLITETVKP